ncbi:hypothetical protein JB92DRAFT_2959055 [Gautieria morchelliformis]|nr:hypothetical protein JB92DRAFT_2959055 [Gautieria morchelliformis]
MPTSPMLIVRLGHPARQPRRSYQSCTNVQVPEMWFDMPKARGCTFIRGFMPTSPMLIVQLRQVPQIVPVLHKRVCPRAVVRHEPERRGVVSAVVPIRVDRHVFSLHAREHKLHPPVAGPCCLQRRSRASCPISLRCSIPSRPWHTAVTATIFSAAVVPTTNSSVSSSSSGSRGRVAELVRIHDGAAGGAVGRIGLALEPDD